MNDEEAPMAERVRERRDATGLSQAAVATACGMTQGHYSKLERGAIEPGRRARQSLERWLGTGSRPAAPTRRPGRLESLARTIERACTEMAGIAREIESNAVGDRATGATRGRGVQTAPGGTDGPRLKPPKDDATGGNRRPNG